MSSAWRRNSCRPRAQGRSRRSVSVGEPRRDAVQQHVDRTWRRWCGGCHASCLGDLTEGWMSAEPSGEDRRPECFEVGLAGESVVEPFETSRRVEEQRSVVASASPGKHDLGPQARHPGPLKVVQRAELGGREQFLGDVRVGGIELGVGRRQSPRRSVGPGPPSGRPRVAGTRLPRRRRHGSSPVRLTVPGRRRRPRPASRLRAHGARRDDRDLTCGSVASASARWMSWRSAGLPDRYAAERTSG